MAKVVYGALLLLLAISTFQLGVAQSGCSNMYTVKAGDSLSSIASAEKTTVSAILAVNPSISDPNKIQAGQTICLPGSAPASNTGAVYSGSGSATYYYDLKTHCPQDAPYPETDMVPECASFTAGPNQQTLRQLGSSNVVAIDMNVLGADRAKYCGKQITIMHNGVQVNPPDGGSFYVWDGCKACVGGVRVDLSLASASSIDSSVCNKGVIPGITWSVSNTQVKAFVA